MVEKTLDLSPAEKDCITLSSEENAADLNVSLDQTLKFITRPGLKQFVENDSVNLQETLCRSVGSLGDNT